ncbi:hypothetical protein ACFX15_028995 [Malus domestica]
MTLLSLIAVHPGPPKLPDPTVHPISRPQSAAHSTTRTCSRLWRPPLLSLGQSNSLFDSDPKPSLSLICSLRYYFSPLSLRLSPLTESDWIPTRSEFDLQTFRVPSSSCPCDCGN